MGEKELQEVIARQTAEREAKLASELVGRHIWQISLGFNVLLHLDADGDHSRVAANFEGPFDVEGPGDLSYSIDDVRFGDAASQVMRLYGHVVESVELQTDNTLRLRFDGGLAIHSTDEDWDISRR
jgi:hypothetical protein